MGFMVYNNIRNRNITLIVMSVLLLMVALTLVAKAAGSLKTVTGRSNAEASQ